MSTCTDLLTLHHTYTHIHTLLLLQTLSFHRMTVTYLEVLIQLTLAVDV